MFYASTNEVCWIEASRNADETRERLNGLAMKEVMLARYGRRNISTVSIVLQVQPKD